MRDRKKVPLDILHHLISLVHHLQLSPLFFILIPFSYSLQTFPPCSGVWKGLGEYDTFHGIHVVRRSLLGFPRHPNNTARNDTGPQTFYEAEKNKWTFTIFICSQLEQSATSGDCGYNCYKKSRILAKLLCHLWGHESHVWRRFIKKEKMIFFSLDGWVPFKKDISLSLCSFSLLQIFWTIWNNSFSLSQ